ncbi:hypothetical protein [Marinobacterium aestuariivivens]|uniref:DUF2783 domain-containing protein n=1 Tax=Marinobacterium aestuariivivens TaxID=1698799 RepID=A0ABW1ZSM6_9GAMM
MTTPNLSVQDLETLYDTLAASLDTVGPDREALFLTKLALLMGPEIGDIERVLELIDKARKDL